MTTDAPIIQQCPLCLRYLCGGALVAVSLGEGFAAAREGRLKTVPCDLPDCQNCVTANAARERSRRPQRVNPRRERQEGRAECRVPQRKVAERSSFAAHSLPPEREDVVLPGPVALTQSVGEVIEKSLSQQDFAASGKADSANCKLRKFFDEAIATGQVGNWFSRKFLKEICANDYINNRIDNLRPVYAARGLKIVNGEVSPDGIRPRTSHYRLLLMTDAEMEKFNQTGVPVIE